MDLSLPSENSDAMSVNKPATANGCRWAWCRFTFSDSDALVKHVIHDHIRCAIPVRRRDISLLRRTEEGMGESLGLSDIMRDPSSSLNTVEKPLDSSRDGSSSQKPPLLSSSLPSPPASSPQLPRKVTDDEDGDGEQPSTCNGDENPTFASLSSPAGSLASLQIPVSPSFSSLVQRQSNKRKLSPSSSDPSQNKRPRQLSPIQELEPLISTGSQRLVEDHLTQSSYSDDMDDYESEDSGSPSSSDDAHGDDDSGESQVGRSPRGDPASVTQTSNLNGSDSDLYKGELNWDVNSSQPATSTQENQEGPVQHLEVLSQPPSQLQLPSFPFHTHNLKQSSSHLHPIETAHVNSSLALPLSSPVLFAPPTDFAISTPQRQNWYQPSSLRRKVSGSGSRRASTENTPKPSVRHELPIPSTIDEESCPRAPQHHTVSPAATKPSTIRQKATPPPPQQQQQSSSQSALTSAHSVVTPLSKIPGFRSGTLWIGHPPTTPVPRPASPMKTAPPPATSITPAVNNANNITEPDKETVALIRSVFTVQEEWNGDSQSQSQFEPSTQFSQEISSYPPLQSQAPYQSQMSYSPLGR